MLPDPTWQQQRAQDHWHELAVLASVHRLSRRPRTPAPSGPWSHLAAKAAAWRDAVRLRPVAVDCCCD